MSKFYQIGLDTIDESFDEIGKVLDLKRLHIMAKKEMESVFQDMNKMMDEVRKDFDNLF